MCNCPTKSGPEERMLWETNACCGRGTPANVARADCTQMCIVGGKNSGFKGFYLDNKQVDCMLLGDIG